MSVWGKGMGDGGVMGKGVAGAVSDGGRWLDQPATVAQAELRQSLDQTASREADEVALRRVWSRLADLPSILPLSAADRVRVEAETARSRRARSPWIVAASLAGVTATLAFLLFESKSEVSDARSARTRSGATQMPQTSPAEIASKRESGDFGSSFVAPATVRTGHGETLKLALRGGTKVVVGSDSVLMLDADDRPSVSAGDVQFQVPPQLPGRTFTVEVGAYRVVVVGTRFNVRMGQAKAAVRVEEGIVEIWTDHPVARLNAGESWASPEVPTPLVAAPAKALPLPTVRASGGASSSGAKDSREPASLGHNGHAARSSRLSRTFAAANVETKRSVLGFPREAQKQPAVLALSAPSTVSSGPAPLVSSAPRPEASVSTASLGVAASVDRPAPNGGEIAPPAVTGGAAAELPPLAIQARTARAAGDSRRALGLYRSLVQKGGTAGENAEYEIGRVLRDGLHQPGEALIAWRTYRSEHPRGLLRIESDLSIIETLVSTGDRAAALTEASDFLRRYPESERRMEVARLAGDLLRERGACADAVKAYDVALGAGRARRDVGRDGTDSLSFYRALCVLREDPMDGTDALKLYLQSFPNGRFRGEAQRLVNGAPAAPATKP